MHTIFHLGVKLCLFLENSSFLVMPSIVFLGDSA